MILLGEYIKNEFLIMIKNSIIRNFEIIKVPFFDYCLCKIGNRHILKHKIFLENLNVLTDIEDSFLYDDIDSLIRYIINYKNLKLLKWSKEKFRDFEEFDLFCDFACKYNNLEMLKFLREGNDPCPWDEHCTKEVTYGNNLEMLKFLREGNDPCPWDESCCYWACRNNNLEMLQFLRSVNDSCPWNKRECIELCIKNNNSKILEWIKTQSD